MNRTLLVDGDIVVYKAAFGAEEVHQFEDQWVSSADINDAKERASTLITSLAENVKADSIIVCLSDDRNWRKELYEPYKQQRKKTRKPILLKPLKAWMHEAYKVYQRPTLEADDVLGILMTSDKIIAGMKIIASIDKDLLQIPGRHINIDSRKKSVVSEPEGERRHMLQTLTGDVVDNYPGCPGIGAVRANMLLGTGEGSHWSKIVSAFEKKGLTEDDALIQARIARICRASDYDFPTKSVRWWTPPSP